MLYPGLVQIPAKLVDRALELLRFGAVGGVAYVVDTGLFNLLLIGPGQLLGQHPMAAKIISAAVATLVAWIGNRYWTFSEQRTDNSVKELIQFGIVNVGGMGVALLCLWVSHYVLGFTSPLADNISANVVGLILGMIFRYVFYKYWVFSGADAADPPQSGSHAAAPPAG